MVSIIILSYNTRDLTVSCLTSLYHHLRGFDSEVLVADNASMDDSVKVIQKKFPKVRLLENHENLGFAKGMNSAVRHAKGEMILFLNSDTTFSDDSLKEMIAFLKKHDAVGIIGGKMKNPDGTPQRSCGKFPTLPAVFSMLFKGDKAELKQIKSDTVQPVDWVSGGFMLVRKNVFEKLGGFDEHFFMYIEDMEFCFRAKKASVEVYYFPDSSVRHKSYGSSNRTFAIVQIYKGIRYFYRKHYGPVLYILVTGMLTLKACLAIIAGVFLRKPQLILTYTKALRS